MSKESIRNLLEAQGSFPDAKEVKANFEALFALAREGGETVDDLAWGFQRVLDQWSHVDAVVDPAVAGPLREWALSQWVSEPYERCLRLCRLLVNLPSAPVRAFLQGRHDEATDPDLRRALAGFLAQMPG